MSRQFKQRILMSSLGILGLVICIFFSFSPLFKPIFILLNTAIISIALLEYYQLAQHKGFQPLISLGIGSTIAYIIALAFSFYHSTWAVLPSFILLSSFLLYFLMFFNQQTGSLANLAITVFGLVYLTLPLACVLRINYFFTEYGLQDGRLWLAYVLIVSKMTDIGAYFCGKSFGKTKLAPMISPKKTIEGAIGGSIASLIASVCTALFFKLNMTFMQSLWIGLLMSVLAQLGDLSESLLKRDAGVKDSSRLPGLGGILDIVDSLIFTLPLTYLLLKMHLVG